MQTMAQVNAETDTQRSQRSQKSNTRQAILDAARRLAARDGAEAITLSNVAAEAGFAPPAVYAYFVTKDDLHLAVVADDLYRLARAMRGDAGTGEADAKPGGEGGETPVAESASVASLVDIQEAIGMVTAAPDADYADDSDEMNEEVPDAFPEEKLGEAATDAAAGQDETSEAAPKGLRARWRRARSKAEPAEPSEVSEAASQDSDSEDAAAALQSGVSEAQDDAEAIAKLRSAVARLESRPVDAWLERRLRVFERTLADIEGRMEKTERDSTTALSTVSEGFKSIEERFQETVENTAQRAAENEQSNRAVTADFRTYVKDLSGRLSAVETSLSRLVGAADASFGMPVANPDAIEDDVPPPDDTPDGGDRGTAEVSEAKDAVEPRDKAKNDNYLAAARRAAISAAEQSDTDRKTKPLDFLKKSSALARGLSISRRTLQIMAGVLALFVTALVASIALHGTTASSAAPAPVPAVTKAKALTADERIVTLAKAGNSKAELVAALKFLNGDGVAADVPSAAYWLRRAAAQHEPLAEYWLGTLYERGHGVPKDGAKALQWYERAAVSGNAKAMYRLGVGYAEGWNGTANYTEAAKWFAKAAGLGVIDAQFNLAVLYERGSGVPQSLGQAFKWYAIAAAHGDAESKSRVDALATQMPNTDVAAAESRATRFKPKRPDPAANVEPTVTEVAQIR
jgi:TPR repeat protein